MTDDEKLAALFGDVPPIADDGFTNRVVALAALEDRLALRRRADLARMAREAAALAGVLAAFAGLASAAPSGDVIPFTSPAMIGLVVLGMWMAVGVRGAVRAV